MGALTALGYYALKKNDITSWESLKKKLFNRGISQEEIGPVANGVINDNENIKQEVADEIHKIINEDNKNVEMIQAKRIRSL